MSFHHIKEDDTVLRLLAGRIPMRLRVSNVDDTLIYCGAWTFDRATGTEVDDDLCWGPAYGRTGSFLARE
jgi:hypothetical protein